MGIYLFTMTASTDEQIDMFTSLFSCGLTTRAIIVLATEQCVNNNDSPRRINVREQLSELQGQLVPNVKAIASLFKRERAPQPILGVTMTQILAAAVRQVSDARLQFTSKSTLNSTEENVLTQLTELASSALMSISQAYLKVQPDKAAILAGVLSMTEATKTVSVITKQEVVPLLHAHNPEHILAIQFCLHALDHCNLQMLTLAAMIGLDYNPTNLHPLVMGLVIRHWCNMVNYMLGIVFVEFHVAMPLVHN